MRRAVAFLLISLQLSAAARLGAQERAGDPRRFNLDSRAIARATIGLESQLPGPLETSDWSRVTALSSGAEIFIETDSFAPQALVFVDADEGQIVVLGTAGIPRSVTRVALERAKNDGRDFFQVLTTRRYVEGDVRLGPEGAFLKGKKVAEIADLVQAIPKTEVRQVTATAERERGLLLGVGVGLLFAGGAVNAAACHCDEPMPTIPGLALTLTGIGFLVQASRAPKSIPGPRRIIYQR